MTDDLDFYDLLDVTPDASSDEIRRAFRRQVRVYHPDLNDDPRAQAQFTAVKKAYDILGDPVERQAYDRLGHEEYVAKRTKGLPSPKLWKTKVEESTGRATATNGGTPSAGGDRYASSRRTAGRRRSRPGARASATSAGRGSVGGSGHETAPRWAVWREFGWSSNPRRSFDSHPVVRWWRRQSLGWPLITAGVLLYVVGLAAYVRANWDGVAALVGELAAAGLEPAAWWGVIQADRYGIEPVAAYLDGAAAFDPFLSGVTWYLLLVCVVLLPIGASLAVRHYWRADTWGPISLDEVIGLSISLTIVGLAIGGPLLAGAIVLPLIFGVIVRRTRQAPGWSPTYLYVVATVAPVFALVASLLGQHALAVEVVALVLAPVGAAFVLPLSAFVRPKLIRAIF